MSALTAFALGALVGLLVILAERVWLGFLSEGSSAALYCLVGGGLAVLGWGVGSLVGSPSLGRILSGLGSSILPGVFLLYVINARLLAGEPFTSPRSIAADVFVACLAAVSAFVGARAIQRLSDNGFVRMAGDVAGVLLLVGNAMVILASASPDPPTPRQRPNDSSLPDLLLVIQDSVRPDHLDLYGYARGTSPSLNRCGLTARVFEEAYAASSWTVPSVDWILNVRDRTPTRLPERLAALGYRTACFSDNPHLTRDSEILKGFQTAWRSVGAWRLLIHATVVGEVLERLDPGSDAALVDRALTWVETEDGPLFLYFHLMDSHAPYDEPPIDGITRKGRRIEFPVTGMEMSAAEREDVVARYDSGISSTDHQVGRLLEVMEARGRPFLAIVASDHGESLGEQGRWYHGGSLAPELLAVHLVVVGSDVDGGRVPGPVGFSSISKTLLMAAGDTCIGCPGIDLREGTDEVFVEGGLPPHLVFRIQDGIKLIWNHSTQEAQLFDLENDPEELTNMASERADLVAKLRRNMGAPQSLPEADPAALGRLRALGYVEDD